MNLTWTIDWNNTVTTLNESEANSFAALITTSYSKASQKATLTEAQIPGLRVLVSRLLYHSCTGSYPSCHSINRSISPCPVSPSSPLHSPPLCLLFLTSLIPTPLSCSRNIHHQPRGNKLARTQRHGHQNNREIDSEPPHGLHCVPKPKDCLCLVGCRAVSRRIASVLPWVLNIDLS